MERKCPTCGTCFGDMANYCGRCGAKLPPPLSPVNAIEKQERYTLLCGSKERHELLAKPFGVEYCIMCGEKISSSLTIH